MNYNQATLHAATGSILILPGWHGYFYWNYATQKLNFRDGNYQLDSAQLKDMNIINRDDWYYIT